MAQRKPAKAKPKTRERSIRESSRRYGDFIAWAQSKYGGAVYMAQMDMLVQIGFTDVEADRIAVVLMRNIHLFIK
jgi:hypothetical protein